MTWIKWRKKPVVVRARLNVGAPYEIVTLEGTMVCNSGDYEIEGVKGERYPCKPDIFKATYTEVSE